MDRLRVSAPWLVPATVAVLALGYVLLGSGLDLDYVIPKRLIRLAAMVVGGLCIAWTAIVFQTLTGNRILTPAVMGYEAVYLLLQSLLVLLAGSQAVTSLGVARHFALSALVMLAYSWLLHRRLFRDGSLEVQSLLLLGMVLTLFLGSVTQFVQFRTSPGEFSMLMGFTQASFNRAQPQALAFGALVVAVVGAAGMRALPTLDVLLLGRDQAQALGVDYRRTMQRQLVAIAVLVAVSTSLLGPTAFMGIFVANAAYALAGTRRHRVTLPVGCALACGMFIAAQFAVEHLFNYRTSVGILVNLVCGSYFLTLMLRTRGNT